jgi:hypothetical protein
MTRLADELADALRRDDAAAVVALARPSPAPALRYLTGRLYSADPGEKWRGVRGLGWLVREPGLVTEARAQDLLQRYLWALNDESGAVPFGVPEAIGEILASRPAFRGRVLPVLCGMLTEADTFQTGAVERGIYWAIGRIGPDVLRCCPGVERVVARAAGGHPDSDTRALAAQVGKVLASEQPCFLP